LFCLCYIHIYKMDFFIGFASPSFLLQLAIIKCLWNNSYCKCRGFCVPSIGSVITGRTKGNNHLLGGWAWSLLCTNGVMLVGKSFAPQKVKYIAWKNIIVMMLGFMDLVSFLNIYPNLPPKKQNHLRSLKRSCIVQRHYFENWSIIYFS
jgi:hypothetical protein